MALAADHLEVKTVPVGMLATQCYVLSLPGREDCLVIDPGAEPEKIRRAMGDRQLAAILLTHGHFDHIGAVAALAQKDTPIWIHRLDAEMLTNPARNLCRMIRTEITAPPATRLLEEGDRLEAAGVELTVLHTPGHTPGSVCFRAGNHLFTGDTLFHGGYGRTDFPGGSPEDMRRSLARLAPLEAACAIYPGH